MAPFFSDRCLLLKEWTQILFLISANPISRQIERKLSLEEINLCVNIKIRVEHAASLRNTPGDFLLFSCISL